MGSSQHTSDAIALPRWTSKYKRNVWHAAGQVANKLTAGGAPYETEPAPYVVGAPGCWYPGGKAPDIVMEELLGKMKRWMGLVLKLEPQIAGSPFAVEILF